MSVIRITRSLNILALKPRPIIIGRFSSDDKSDKNQIKEDIIEEKQSEELAKNDPVSRLNSLLASMSTDVDGKFEYVVPTPKQRRGLQKVKERTEEEIESENIVEAARNVANLIGGDAKQTESELLSKLLNFSQNDTEKPNLGNLISGMKIDQTPKKPQEQQQPRSEFVRRTMSRQNVDQYDSNSANQQDSQNRDKFRKNKRNKNEILEAKMSAGSVDLFGSEEPLGIFTNLNELKESPDILKTWSALQQRELKLAVTHPPSNYFQKMALWTEQGKLWKFPIDNEQGLEEEAKVYFTEHLFLDQHLEGWCPTKGPVRHFMELVCVGLSKNPYFTVAQKREHIEWFRDYFQEKKDILQRTILIDSKNESPQLGK